MKKMNPYYAIPNPFDLFYAPAFRFAPAFRNPYWGFTEYPFGMHPMKPCKGSKHDEHSCKDLKPAGQPSKDQMPAEQRASALAQKPENQTSCAIAPGMKRFGLMRTDVKETDEAYELLMNLPGFKKEDVKVELKDGYLTVSATSQEAHDETAEEGAFIRRERYSGTCQRSFWLGDEVLEDGIKAKFDEGVLTINVPKDLKAIEEKAPREIAVA